MNKSENDKVGSVNKMKMLLHMCCGPCSAFPLKRLRALGHDPTGYFFNPNIHPYKEFMHRLETAKEFSEKVNLQMLFDSDYPLENFLRKALNAPEGRCKMCYDLRLRQVARYAKENNYECFTTSLLVSPYQNHEVITTTAQQIAREEGIAFIYEDFRQGWQEGVQMSRDLELYRQPYCGCIFSEKERYCKEDRKKQKSK